MRLQAGGGESGRGAGEVAWEHVKEGSGARGAEDQPADVVVDLDGIVDACFVEQGFDALGSAELLADVEEVEFLVAEELR